MSEKCPDCHGIPNFFDSPCPTCKGRANLGTSGTRGGRRSSKEFRASVEAKLASQEWKEMVRWARQQVGLPPQGLQPEEAQEFFLGAMINLLMPCMLLHPKLGPQLVEQLGTQLPEQVSGLSDSELERGVRAFLMSTPHRLLNLRFAAVYLASWLGIEDEDSVMTYLVSPERWPLHNVSPVGRTKPGPTQVPAIAEIFSSLLPLPRSQRVIKGILLRGFVKGSRTILPQLGEEQATWEQITEIWNALFPEWRFDHWRNLRKAHEYSLLQKQADGQQSTLN